MREFLIYTSAGHHPNVKQWSSSPDRNYDIWVTNYTGIPDHSRQYADHYNERIGSKFQNLKAITAEHGELLSQYKAIMVADDDIIISPQSLSALFSTLMAKDLFALQPAFSRYGQVSHPITARKLKSDLRYVNFVEVTCPIFRSDILLDFLSVYDPDISTCYGIDWWYMHHMGKDRKDKYAISDRHFCINPEIIDKETRNREINRLNNPSQRIQMWENIKARYSLYDFPQQEFKVINKKWQDVLRSTPGLISELTYNLVNKPTRCTLDKLRVKLIKMLPGRMKQFLKKLLKRESTATLHHRSSI